MLPGLEGSRLGTFSPRTTPGGAPRARWAWHLSAGLGALFTASHCCGDQSLGGRREDRSQWLEERSPGIRMPNEERGAIGDTEILIRGSLWGGIYYSVLIGCGVAIQHPGRA